MRVKRRILVPILLLALFTAYQVSITMFTHVHYVNGVMIVHSHPSSNKHHTHTKSELVVIHNLSIIHTLEGHSFTLCEVKAPVIYVLEPMLVTSFVTSVHLNPLSLRAPPVV